MFQVFVVLYYVYTYLYDISEAFFYEHKNFISFFTPFIIKINLNLFIESKYLYYIPISTFIYMLEKEMKF